MKLIFPAKPYMVTPHGRSWMPVHLRYEPKLDPYAVALVIFEPGFEPVRWLLGRELLREGLHRPAGEQAADVRVTPGVTTVGVHLHSPSGCAVAVFARGEVESFVQTVFLAVPEGTEHKHLDWSDAAQVLQ